MTLVYLGPLDKVNIRAGGKSNVDALNVPPPAEGSSAFVVRGEINVGDVGTKVICALVDGCNLSEIAIISSLRDIDKASGI
jgi:hypothetical protein